MFCVKNGTKKKIIHISERAASDAVSPSADPAPAPPASMCRWRQGFSSSSLPAGLSHLRGLRSGDTRSWRIVGCIFPILLQARLHVVTVLVITKATSSVGTLAMLPCHCWPSKCSVSLNPVLCFEMSSFIKLTQLKVSASSLSLSSTMIVPEPSPG